jgi:hypothetical protein
MAKNIQSLQLLRNSQIFQDKAAAINGITGATTQDGVIKLARYTEGTATKTIFGIYNDNTVGTAGYTIYESYKEVIDAIQDKIADLESGSTEAVDEIWDALGDGVSSANTVSDQLEALSGSDSDTSATTSVAGAKKYADEKIAEAVADLDYTDTAVTGSYVSKVDEADGVISVTREALPSLPEVYEAGKPIIAVSEDKGQVAASAGTINAEFVNVTGDTFSSSTVQAALEEIETEYKAADAALKTEILGGASASADTLGELEALINNISAEAKEYHIVKTTTGLSAEIKESYSLQDADGHVSGDTIDIPKDSHIVSINYITTGEHAQNLEYVYVDVSGNTKTTYVDMSSLVIEAEFASGVTATDHIVHGVVDSTSEKDSQTTPVDFLTVGENGFKVSGIKDEIDRKINALDASVTGGTTAGTATSDHIQVVVDEVDGKLTAVTVTEANIANASDLAALSAKTVTEIASSNDSITAALSAAADGTKQLDIITDASKIQMSGFTNADVLSGITQSSSITEAFLEVDKVITANEQVTAQALNDLEGTKVENINVNGVAGTFSNKVASVTIDGNDVVLGADYEKPAQGSAIATGDTVDKALGKLEAKVDAATSGGITGATVNNAPLAITSNALTQTVVGKQSEATATNNEAIVVETDANGNLTLGLANLDAGTY